MSLPTVITMGCRLNAFETEVMRQHAAAAGLGDAVIVNTCAVTTEAVRQAAQSIRRLKREQPNARMIVTGCAAQIAPDRFAGMPEVDHVVGNAEKMAAATFRALALGRPPRVMVGDIMAERAARPQRLDGLGQGSHGPMARAWIEIQNGCDHRCTFCIIPFGRGPSRSVPAAEVVAHARHLVEVGAREIVLTGVDVTSYGEDLPGRRDGDMTLGRLVRQLLAEVPELRRLRLSSIDVAEVDRHLLEAIADEPRLMPHLHLSLQAGDDLILKRMKRRHSRSAAIAFCAHVRRLRPDIAVGADLIAGFPTETEAQFDQTLALVDECGLSFLHVFPFSARQGTPAARMPLVAGEQVKARAARLRAKGGAVQHDWLARQHDRETDVYIERDCLARTPQFAEVVVSGQAVPAAIGETVRARVGGHDGRRLQAEALA